MQRIIAIGDVHGCFLELEELLNLLCLNSTDKIIFLGDVVGKGPFTKKCLDLILSLDNTICLMGNYEQKFLKSKNNPDPKKMRKNSYEAIKSLDKKHWNFLSKLPLTFFSPKSNAVFVHGGFIPNIHWSLQPSEIVTTIQVLNSSFKPQKRSNCPNGTPWFDLWKSPETVIYGHFPHCKVNFKNNTIGVDTGCVYGRQLSALILPTMQVVQVNAKQVWA